MPSFEKFFMESKGKPITYKGKTLVMMDTIEVSNGDRVKITFDSTDSEWRQGIALDVKGSFIINDRDDGGSIILWEDTAPKVVELEITTKPKNKPQRLAINNAWDTGDGVTHSWHNGAAMIIEDIANGRRYSCNDGHPDDNFTDIVFRVHLLAKRGTEVSDQNSAKDIAQEHGYFFAPESESQERAGRVLPSKGSEDVSHLLKLSVTGNAAKELDDERDYLPNPQVEWIVHVDFAGDPVLDRSDLLKVLSPEWAEGSGTPQLFGYSSEDERWTYLRAGGVPETFTKLRFSWQLYDTLSEPPIAMTALNLRRFAESVGKTCQQFGNASVKREASPEDGEKRAAMLGELAESCDREIVVILQPPPGKTFEGRDIWDVMLCLGLPWGDMDIFHWPNESEAGHDTFFSVWTSTPPGHFFPESIAASQVHAEDLVFGYSLPRSADPAAVFIEMVKAARYTQKRLGGDLLDTSGEALNEAETLAVIEAISERLKKAGFSPGSNAALFLF